MLQSDQAIALRTVRLGNDKQITDFLTLGRGRVSCVVKVSRGKSAVRTQLLQPLSLVEIQYEQKPTARLFPLKHAAMRRPLMTLHTDMAKLSIAIFLAEFISSATYGEKEPNEPLFRFVEQSLLWLDACTGSYANFHLVFMLNLTVFIGLLPNTDDYRPGHCFDLREGTFTPYVPVHRDFLPPAEATVLCQLMRLRYDTMHLFRMSRTDRFRCIEAILRFYRLHVPDFRELKSLDIVSELFD